jgi:hypothetical protein
MAVSAPLPWEQDPSGSEHVRVVRTFPMLIRMSALTPSPTQRFIPCPIGDRARPCRRFRTLMRPPQPVRQRCAFLNQRRCSFFFRLSAGKLTEQAIDWVSKARPFGLDDGLDLGSTSTRLTKETRLSGRGWGLKTRKRRIGSIATDPSCFWTGYDSVVGSVIRGIHGRNEVIQRNTVVERGCPADRWIVTVQV